MKHKLVQIVQAAKRTVKQRVCKHIYTVNINQVIDIQKPLKYECKKCNKIVWEERHLGK